MTKNNKIYFKTPSQTVGPFFGNYLNFNLSKKTYTNFNEKIDSQIMLKLSLKDKKKQLVKDAFIECWQVLHNNNNLLYFNRINYSAKKKSYLIRLQYCTIMTECRIGTSRLIELETSQRMLTMPRIGFTSCHV